LIKPLSAEKEKNYARAICAFAGEVPECIYWGSYKSKEAFQEIWADRCYWKHRAQKYQKLLTRKKRGEKNGEH
jgi:hypothetical protein